MRQLFNEGWQFVKTGADCLYETAESMEKQPVCLPHDWAIGDIEQFYRDVDGWYFKTFKASFLKKADTSNSCVLRFAIVRRPFC